ncbi:MAG TPA: NUDIX domain-containing protein [Streptosporangiaceae bacterium]|nr:NUDIX domain-containing protein [Streptosporangiaceae bacterium]
MEQGVRIRCAGLLMRDGRILMESLVDAERWSPVGGGLEPGETVPEAIQREFREELGWDVTVGEMVVVTDDLFANDGRSEHAITFFALVEGGPGDGALPPRPPGEDHQELAWIPLAQLGELTLLPQHLAEDIPAALSAGQLVFHSERRI